MKTQLREPWISNKKKMSQAIELELYKHAKTKSEYLKYRNALESHICQILQKRIDKVKKKIEYEREWQETLEYLKNMPTETLFVPKTTTVTQQQGTKLTLNVHKRQKIIH